MGGGWGDIWGCGTAASSQPARGAAPQQTRTHTPPLPHGPNYS